MTWKLGRVESDLAGSEGLEGRNAVNIKPLKIVSSSPLPILPKELVEKVATQHLPVLGAVLTVFSEEHADYTGVKVEGPLRSGHYRFLLFSFTTRGWRSLIC